MGLVRRFRLLTHHPVPIPHKLIRRMAAAHSRFSIVSLIPPVQPQGPKAGKRHKGFLGLLRFPPDSGLKVGKAVYHRIRFALGGLPGQGTEIKRLACKAALGQLQALDVLKERLHAVIFALDCAPDVCQSGDSKSSSSASLPPITVLRWALFYAPLTDGSAVGSRPLHQLPSDIPVRRIVQGASIETAPLQRQATMPFGHRSDLSRRPLCYDGLTIR